MSRRRLGLVLILWLCLGCVTPGDGQPDDSLEARRAQDSTLGASRLPGAGGVRGALRAADSAAARRQRADSLAATP